MVMYRLKLLKLMLHHAENTAICVEQQCADALTIAAAIQKMDGSDPFFRASCSDPKNGCFEGLGSCSCDLSCR
jgi:hypothetical protein